MPCRLTLEIRPENFNFFKYKFLKFLLSPAQKTVIQGLKKAHEDISRLKKQDFFEFTASNEFHIARGGAYAITDLLQERFHRLKNLQDAFEQKKISLHKLRTLLANHQNNVNDLPEMLEQEGINLEDLYSVLKQKQISLEELQTTLELKKISLEELQEAFEKSYHIDNKEVLSSIILCLVEPVWIPGSLSALALSLLLPTDYYCTNQSGSAFENSILQVNSREDSNSIEFCLNLQIIDIHHSHHVEGLTNIRFSIEKTIPLQIKLLPITMEFDFSNEQKSKQFKKKLAKHFKDWLLYQNELDDLPIKLADWRATQIDFCMFPLSIGLIIGLAAMCSLIALGLTPFSPLLLPAMGLALGLILSVVLNAYAQINIKGEKQKIQRPIYLYNEKPMQTTTLFNRAMPIISSNSSETQLILNKSP